MMTNIFKSLNSILVADREYPISTLFDSISYRFANKFRERHRKFVNSKSNFMPMIEKHIGEKIIKGDSLHVNNVNEDEFTIIDYGPTAKVNLNYRTYTCIEYDLVKV